MPRAQSRGALRPMAEKNSSAGLSADQVLIDNVRHNIWGIVRYKERPWDKGKLRRCIARANRIMRYPKSLDALKDPFLNYLRLLERGLELIDNKRPKLQANFLLYIARKIKGQYESVGACWQHRETIRQLHRDLIEMAFPRSLLPKIREFKSVGAEKESSKKLKDLNGLLRRHYGVSFKEIIGYMYSMGDGLTGELFNWVPK